jgi:hypothetical protein
MKKTLVIILSAWSFSTFSQANFYQWADQVGGINNDAVISVAADSVGNTYSYGYSSSTTAVDFDPGSGTFLGPVGSCKFILKLNASGGLVWAKFLVGTNDFLFGRLQIDKTGNVYIIDRFRTFSSVVDFNPGAGTVNLSSSVGSAFILKLDNGGNYVWVKTFDPVAAGSIYPMGRDVDIDDAGNVYCLLRYTGTMDVNPGAATLTYGSGSPGSVSSSVVVKLDVSGNFVWATNQGTFQGSSTYSYDLNSIEVNAAGNVFVAGDYSPSAGTAGSYELYFAMINSGGAMTAARSSDGTGGMASLLDMCMDKDGNLLLTGNFSGTVNFNSIGSYNYTSSGSVDVFIMKYSAFGAVIWIKTMGGTNHQDYGTGLASDSDANVYCTGYFQSSVFDADPGTGVHNLPLFASKDAFVVCLTSSGNFSWAKSFGGFENETPSGITLDTQRNVYIGGNFDGNCDFDPDAAVANLTTNGATDGFVLKLSNCIYNAPDICLVTVDSLADNNVIYWDKAMYPLADSFIVYRYDALSTNYLPIGSIAMSDPNNFLIDTARNVAGPNGGNPQYSSYKYKMAIRGACGDLGTLGLYHESIFIQQNSQNFSWNAYAIEGQSSPASGYQFLRDNNNTGTWQVLVNTGGLSTTDPNYASYPNGNWRVDALGFSCMSTARLNGSNQAMGAINTSRSNIKSPTSTIGIKGYTDVLKVNVYPVPADESITVEVKDISGTVTIVMENMLGQLVYKVASKEEKTIIWCAGMKPGVYSVIVRSAKSQTIRKVIVQ